VDGGRLNRRSVAHVQSHQAHRILLWAPVVELRGEVPAFAWAQRPGGGAIEADRLDARGMVQDSPISKEVIRID